MLTHLANSNETPRRVVVLGAGGFVGRALVASLAAVGIETLAVTRADLDLSADWAGTHLAAMLRAGDAVVFAAALTPDRGKDPATLLANLRMADAVTQAAAKGGVGHLVYLSSDAVYPFATGLIDERSAAAPDDLYGTMHRAREVLLASQITAPLCVLRPCAVYGAGDTHNSYGPNRFARMLQAGQPVKLFGQGEEMRDHLYIDDLLAVIRLVLAQRSQGVLNVASGRSLSFGDLVRIQGEIAGVTPVIDKLPRSGPITHRHFDITALAKSFPTFAPVALEDGLARLWQGLGA